MSILKDHKFQASLTSALIFLVVSQPKVYHVTNKKFNIDSVCPTLITKLLHVVVFFILSLAVMHWFTHEHNNNVLMQAKCAYFAAILFFFLSSPEVYNFTNNLFGLTNDVNCPAQDGILLHGIVFLGVIYALMNIHESKEQFVYHSNKDKKH